MIHIKYNIIFDDIGEALEALESTEWENIIKECEEEFVIERDMAFDKDAEGNDIFIVDISVHDKEK